MKGDVGCQCFILPTVATRYVFPVLTLALTTQLSYAVDFLWLLTWRSQPFQLTSFITPPKVRRGQHNNMKVTSQSLSFSNS